MPHFNTEHPHVPVSWPLASESAGNLFDAITTFIDVGSRREICKVTLAGLIYIVAGAGEPDFSGDGGPETSATININAIAVDGFGDLFIAEPGMSGICEITTDGIINTIAGRRNVFLRRFPGREVPFGIRAMAALQIADFSSITVDRAGIVYVADTSNDAIRVARPAP